MTRRVGRYTKNETAELTRMFGEGYSVYKICRNLTLVKTQLETT